MKSNLPFNLNVKPSRRYLNGGSLYYKISNGKLFCIVTNTTKLSKAKLFEFEVTSKEQLQSLKSLQSIDEIPKLTEVTN